MRFAVGYQLAEDGEESFLDIVRDYRTQVAEHHPDRLIAKGVPEELIDVATARMQAINQAYNKIIKLPPPRSAA